MTLPTPLVLLVEDNAADATLFMELLLDLRPAVSVVHRDTGERALAWLRDRCEDASSPAPRLILMDLRLPGQSGLETLQTLRADPRLRLLPVVILSTSDRQSDVDACHGAGANAYLVKANDPDVLGSMLAVAVDLFCRASCPPSVGVPPP